MNSSVSHHITSILHNLIIHSEYGGNEDITISDGSGIPIAHMGSTTFATPTHNFTLNDVLCAPSIHKNVLSVSQFCKHNQVFIEFFPTHFLVKDLSTGASIVRGRNRGNVYEWPSPSHQNLLHTLSSLPKYLLTIGIDI